MRRLHWIVLRRLPGPFFGWLGTLMFLLLMQFLIRWLPEIAGKGIPFWVIVELIIYNLAYMLVLAVPMSVLLAALMAFGGLAESQYYAVIKSTGISFQQLAWPAMVVALLVTGGMTYFNNVLLPDANHRASTLWRDIRTKRPGFSLQPGVFYSGVDHYSILVRDRPPGTNRLVDITIYDYTRGRRQQAVIKAARGSIDPEASGQASLALRLEDGEMHRVLPPRGGEPRYERLQFDRHMLRLDLSDFTFERSSPREKRRSDRTMRTTAMMQAVDSLSATLADAQNDMFLKVARALYPDTVQADAEIATTAPSPSADGAASRDALSRPPPSVGVSAPAAKPGMKPGSARPVRTRSAQTQSDTTRAGAAWATPFIALRGLSGDAQQAVATSAVREARTLESRLRNYHRSTGWKQSRIVQYRVEIYKKFSIATACLVFMFIGIPLGLSIRRGGLATIGALALGIFMFHWVTLVQGEKMADRGLLDAWIGMWIANLLMLFVGIWLVVYVVMDLRATPPLRRRFWLWLKRMLGG